MRASIIFLCALVVALAGAFGHYVFTGRPGSADYVPSDAFAAIASGLLIVAAVGAGAIGLLFFAKRD